MQFRTGLCPGPRWGRFIYDAPPHPLYSRLGRGHLSPFPTSSTPSASRPPCLTTFQNLLPPLYGRIACIAIAQTRPTATNVARSVVCVSMCVCVCVRQCEPRENSWIDRLVPWGGRLVRAGWRNHVVWGRTLSSAIATAVERSVHSADAALCQIRAYCDHLFNQANLATPRRVISLQFRNDLYSAECRREHNGLR